MEGHPVSFVLFCHHFTDLWPELPLKRILLSANQMYSKVVPVFLCQGGSRLRPNETGTEDHDSIFDGLQPLLYLFDISRVS